MDLAANASARLKGVVRVFIDAVEAFNKNDWDQYKTFLDNKAVAYNITSHGYIIGRDKIADYFRSISDPEDPNGLQFAPTNAITWFPGIFPVSVSGVALWTHKAHGHNKAPIHYQFQFYPGNSHALTAIWSEHSEHVRHR